MKIEFVSYDGVYPNLCRGTLVVKINGKTVSFGDVEADYPRFWCSGGSTCFIGGYDGEAHSLRAPWTMEMADKNCYPAKTWKMLPKILEVMNENTQHGCCGGCL